MRHLVEIITGIVATCLLGIMAGFFFAFAVDVAPAMTHLDAAGYITTQQWINRVVRNAVFGAAYFGSAFFPFIAAALAFWCGRRGVGVSWLVIALVYFAAVFWVTRSVNVPINIEMAAWQPATPPSHWQQARDTWNQGNLVRAIASAASFFAAVAVIAARRPLSRH